MRQKLTFQQTQEQTIKKQQHKVNKNNAQGLNIKRKKQPTLKNKNLYYAMTYRRRV